MNTYLLLIIFKFKSKSKPKFNEKLLLINNKLINNY